VYSNNPVLHLYIRCYVAVNKPVLSYLLALFVVQNGHGHPLRTWFPKKMDCGDYRHLNLVTTSDKYPLPNMQDLSNGLHGCTVISKIDLVKDYHQITVANEDIPKTAIITPFGLLNIFSHLLGCPMPHKLSKE
jgi:hypothetical protein